MLEIISPAGFERYFEELAGVLSEGGEPDLARLSEIAGRYGLVFRVERVPELLERHGLTLRQRVYHARSPRNVPALSMAEDFWPPGGCAEPPRGAHSGRAARARRG